MTDATAALAAQIAVSIDLPRLFQQHTGLPVPDAVDNLSGRTHYYDPANTRYLKCHIHTCVVLDSGLILGTVESVKGPGTKREYRPRFFDLFGNLLSDPSGLGVDPVRYPIGRTWLTLVAARRAFWKTANTLDAVAITREALANRSRRLAAESAQTSAVLASCWQEA